MGAAVKCDWSPGVPNLRIPTYQTMGVRGLGGFIRWKLPHVRKTLDWRKHTGKRWGVDCSCLLYRARGVSLSPVSVIASLIVRLRRSNIEPVFVFDGRTPTVKGDVVDQRRVVRQAAQREMAEIKVDLAEGGLTEIQKAEMDRRHADLQKKAPVVTSGDKDDVKTFLHAAGVLFVTAAGEADDVLAYLCRDGTLQGVVSTDMDMLARGVPYLIVPETNDASVLTEICLGDVLSGIGLQYTQFVDACMLMGSDYSGKGWRSMEPKAAIEMARSGVQWAEIDISGSVCSVMERGVALLLGSGIQWEDIIGERQRAKWLLGQPTREPDTIATLAKSHGWPVDWVPVLGG